MPAADSAEQRRAALERFYDAFNARDLQRLIAEMHTQVEFESRFARAGGTTYRGHDGIRGWLADLADAWEHIAVELERAFEMDDGRTVALITLHGKGRANGIELHERAAHKLRWREGKLLSLTYVEREDAGLA
jgi:ketosteroid isomerase-like protein